LAWSLAITALELAEGQPPHSNIHHLRAIFVIPKSDPPVLRDQAKWSDEFHQFLKVCLNKDASKRPSATELLTHPFIQKAPSKENIAKLVAECMPKVEEIRTMEQKQQVEQGTLKKMTMKKPRESNNDTGSNTGGGGDEGSGGGTMVEKAGDFQMPDHLKGGTLVAPKKD